MRHWYVSHVHGTEEFTAHLVEVPLWALALTSAAEAVDVFARHRLCWLWAAAEELEYSRTRELCQVKVSAVNAEALGWVDPFAGVDE